jgi:hypothetical protein
VFIVVLGVVAALTCAGIPTILAFLATAPIATYARAVNFDYPYVERLVALTARSVPRSSSACRPQPGRPPP